MGDTKHTPGPWKIERHVPLSVYLAGIRKARARPDGWFKQGLTCWRPCTGRDIVSRFLDGVNDRINTRCGTTHVVEQHATTHVVEQRVTIRRFRMSIVERR